MFDKIFKYFFPLYDKLTEDEKSKARRKPLTFVLAAVLLLSYFSYSLYSNRNQDDLRWQRHLTLTKAQQEELNSVSTHATKVLCGTYLSNIYNLNLKGSVSYTLYVWFKWQGDPKLDLANHFHIYNSVITKKQIMRNYREGDINYQMVRLNANLSKDFKTSSFPLDSHQLYLALEPDLTARAVVLVADTENSSVNEHISLPGFSVVRSAVAAIPYTYAHSRADMRLEKETQGKNVVSQLVTAVEIDREGVGLHLKCFIGLFGCLIWVIIVMYLNIYHRIDPLSMVPAALFGSVANMMVGASLLPDALEMGLLEYVNIWGIFIILSVAITVINVNAIRREQKAAGQEHAYLAAVYGRIMFYIITFFVVLGNVVLPSIVAFAW